MMTDTIDHLSLLASALCQDADIRLEVSRRAITWAWDPVRRRIIVPVDDLHQRGPVYCAGVLAHEVGHHWISRYPCFVIPFASLPILRLLCNALEDPRVNTWIARRYPGTQPWLQEAAEIDLRASAEPLLQPAVFQFALECPREEWRGWQPAPPGSLPPEVEEALDQTRAARRAFAETLPTADLDPAAFGPDIAERHRREVVPRLLRTMPRTLPGPREQVVRVSVVESLLLARF